MVRDLNILFLDGIVQKEPMGIIVQFYMKIMHGILRKGICGRHNILY